MKIYCIILLILLPALIPIGVQATVYIVPAGQDGRLEEADPPGNHGTDKQSFINRAPSDSLAFRVKTGRYTGDGSGFRSILDVGFQPDFVIIKGDNNEPAVARSRTMVGDATKELGTNTAIFSDLILSLDADGFAVGSGNQVNDAGVTYYWIAFQESPDYMVTGSYTGDDQDDRDITDVGFEPDYVIVMSEANEDAMQRFDGEAVDKSLPFSASDEKSDRIQDFLPNGFQVGIHNTVNEQDIVFHYVAWKNMLGQIKVNFYNGNQIDDHPITTVGFRPFYVIVARSANGSGSVHRPASLEGDNTLLFEPGPLFSNGIQTFLPNGFEIGTDNAVNKLGEKYYYAAFGDIGMLDLSLTKDVNDNTPNEGDTITFHISLTNDGPDDGTGIKVVDLLPPDLTFVSYSSSQGIYAQGNGNWTVGDLVNGATASLDLAARVKAGTGGSEIVNIARISASDQSESNYTNDADSAVVTVENADLSLTKLVDNTLPNETDTVSYAIKIVNYGPQNATGVEVADSLPAGVTYLSDSTSQGVFESASGLWTVGSVAAADSATLILTAVVDEGTSGSTITNTALVTEADQADPNGTNNSASAVITVQNVDLSIVKTVSEPSPNEGDTLTYNITLTNNGAIAATGIEVTDLLPAGVTYLSDSASQGSYVNGTGLWTVGDVSAADSATLLIAAMVDAGTGESIITNEAAITAADQADPDTTNNTASAFIAVQSADLQLEKTVDNSTPNEGDTLTYTITLANNGPNTATGIEVTDSLPAGVTFLSDTPSQGAYASGTGVWDVGAIANADSAVLQLQATVDAGTAGSIITNGAAVTKILQGDPDGTNNTDTVSVTILLADLALTKTVDDPIPNEGDTLSYGVTIVNNGPHAATGIEITDLLPAGVTYLSDTPSRGSYEDGTGIWNVGAISNGDSATLLINASVDGGTGGSTITNTADITAADQADPDGGNNGDSAGITVQSADLSIQKVAGNPVPNEGDTLTYTITLTNNGPDTATGIGVTDLLPAGITYLSDAPSQGIYQSSTGLWTVGTLAGSQNAQLVLTGVVDSGTGGSTIINSVLIESSDQADPDEGNNNDSAEIIVQSADLEIVKTVNKAFPIMGDTIMYTITVTNNGPNAATGVAITDLLPGGVTYISDAPSQGSYANGTGLWLVGTVNNAGGAALNITAAVNTGTIDSTITNSASITACEVTDPNGSNNSDTAAITVVVPVELQDTPNSLYPATAFLDDPELALRIGIDNQTNCGTMLDTSSAIEFTDGVKTYRANLGNPTYIPPAAKNFIITFLPEAMPAGIAAPASYDLKLMLSGVDDYAKTYRDTISTAGRNSLYIDIPRIVVSEAELGVSTVYPGAVDQALLAVKFENQYPDIRFLDSLTVTNTSIGSGSQSDLDGECSLLSMYDDADGDGIFSTADTLMANSSFASGRAVFEISGNYAIPGESNRFLFVLASVDSSMARDGDRINAVVASPFDVRFAGGTEIEDNFSPLDPIDSFGYLVVDGMAAHQITLIASPVDTLLSGTADNLILTAIFPSNGYESDVLSALAIKDISGDFHPGDFSALKLYRDDGDTQFNPSSDQYLGGMVYSGDRYQISGINEPVGSNERFFVSADVSTYPNNGDYFRPSIPLGGVEVMSANDGPIDVPASVDSIYTFRLIEQIEVSSLPLPDRSPGAGETDVSLLLLRIKNNTVSPVTLDSLAAENISSGPGTVDELDREFSMIRIYSDDGNGVVDSWDEPLSADLFFSGGSLVARDLHKDLSIGETAHLLFACGIDSVCASDGDTLGVAVSSAGSMYFDSPERIEGDFPLATFQEIIVDGMMSFQIHLFPAVDSVIVAQFNDILVFDFSLPANGYQSDTLTSLRIYNQGSASSEHFSRLALYADGGDGSFDAGTGDDSYIDDFVYMGGKSYLLPDLNLSLSEICGDGTRFFVSADLHTAYSTSATIQFEIPLQGIRVTSGNDGPIDAPVLDPAIRFIPKPNELIVFPYSLEDKRVYPGSRKILNFGVGFYNGYSSLFTLEQIELALEGTVVDSEIKAVFAYEDADTNGLFNPLLDNLLTEADLVNSNYVMNDLDLPLRSKKITYLFIAYDLELSSRDSVSINFQLESNEHITLSNESIEIQGEFPINSPGTDMTDGMVSAQIDMIPSPPYQAALGEEDALCLSFTIPANGTLIDMLQSISVLNAGTATPASDISILKLWTEDGGDPANFDPTQDRFLSFLTWNGNSWRNPSELSETIPISGLKCYITFDVSNTAADGTTMIGRIPIGGIKVLSSNDGPIDKIIDNPDEQMISAAALLTSLWADRFSYSIGQGIQLSMRVRNTGETPLSGVTPSAIEISGSGAADYLSGPSLGVFDLPSKSDTTVVWQYSAVSAGELELCGYAHTADSSKVSRQTCAAIDLQKKPQDITVSLSDLSPTSANRGQQNVPLFNIGCANVTVDSLVASAVFDGFNLYFENSAGESLPPNSVLQDLTMVNPQGGQYFFTMVDSSSSPVSLRFAPPIPVVPGGSVALNAFCHISQDADLTPFRLSFESITDIRVKDSNDAAFLPVSSQNTFPWVTNEIDINAQAESLLVSTSCEDTVYANLDQDGVLAFDLHLLNSGGPATASELLTHLTLSFFDTTGSPLPPAAVIREISLSSSGRIIYQSDVIPSGGYELVCNLKSPFVLQPRIERNLGVLLDLRSLPESDAFYITVQNPLHITARDFNTGHLITVSPIDPEHDFPMVSSVMIFQSPASAVEIIHKSTLPPTILPSQSSVPVMDLIFSHSDTVSASSIELDSLVVVFSRAGGEHLIPGEYFSHMCLTNRGDTLSFNSSLSSFLPTAELKIQPPLLITQSSPETLKVYLGTKSLYSPASFEARIEKDHLFLIDANDDSRFYSIAGQFPLTTNIGTLQLPSTLALAGMNSKMPANITGSQNDLHAFDLIVANGNPQGSTNIELRRVEVTLENNRGGKHIPTQFLSSAYLAKGDSIISQGEIGNSAITFLIPDKLVCVSAGSADTLNFLADIETQFAGDNIRFVIEDTTSLDAIDEITREAISFGTVSANGFPLRSESAHILSADIEKAFTNYPNPFAAGKEHTNITFYLNVQSYVTLKVYTIWGAPVIDLLTDRLFPPGLHQNIVWSGINSDGDTVNNGVYYLVLEIRAAQGGQQSVKRKVGVIR